MLIFTFPVENEFSGKEIPHIDKDYRKAFADDIVLVNGYKRAEHGIFDEESHRLKDILFGKRSDNELGKPQTDNADNGKADEINGTVFDFGFCEHPERRNDIVDGQTGYETKDNRPCFRHFKKFLAEYHNEQVHHRGKTAYKYTSEELNGSIACFLNKEFVK